MTGSPTAAEPQPEAASPGVSTRAATAVVVADMIGVGVFTSLGFQVAAVPSGFAVLLLWAVGGLVALSGALCYAELAAMFPRSGGEYALLARAYGPRLGPPLGFMAGWVSATVGFSAPVALAAMAFGRYAQGVWPGLPPLPLGLGLVWAVALVHLRGVRRGSAFQVWATGLKLALIAFLVAAGLLGGAQPVDLAPAPADLGRVFSAGFAVSLVFVMYAYSGWNAATYIVGEMADPARGLPRALVIGTSVVTALYVLLNAAFLRAAPLPELSGQVEVALIAGRHLFGEAGGRLVGALICVGLVPTVSAMTWIGPRVSVAMGEDAAPLRALARRTRAGVPRAAILLQAGVASLLLLTGGFEAVLEFVQSALILCAALTVLGLVRLRIAAPDLPRPCRAWGYPLTPIVFLAVSLLMLGQLAASRPLQALAGFGVMLLGLLLHAALARGAAGGDAGEAPRSPG